MFHRVCAQPSPETFSIPPIRDLVAGYAEKAKVIVDPFARNSLVATHRNDLDPRTAAEHHLPAVEYLRTVTEEADLVLFDPPYSPRQISECYRGIGLKATMRDTQNARLYRECRELIDELVRPGGHVISCGWNSVGMGKAWERVETLLVCHGGAHNDTIVVVDRKPL